MLILSRLSFRQLLLAAFLLIAILLGGASVHVLLTLERLAAHSRQATLHAVQLTENAQRLAERTVAMERSAQQFLVLGDPVFRDRSRAAWREARNALDALAAALPESARADVAQWNTQCDIAWTVLQSGRPRRRANHAALSRAFARLPAINDRLAVEGKREVERLNNALRAELEQRRSLLTGQVLISIVLAALIAFGFSVWLARPVVRIERAIERLGEGRFDEPVEVHGPEDLRRVGRHLDWLRRRLAALEADKARFLLHVSHELKTPLAALCEGVALLDDEVAGTLSDNQREVARILRHNTSALQVQIEDLLRYNAATFDAQHLQRQPVDLCALLFKTIDHQRLQCQARGLQVTVEGTAPVLASDPEKLGVAIGNLLSNAIRFSPEDGSIRFTLGQNGNRVTLDCHDDGPGVAPADAARIFEPFYQGERQPPGARRGSGIGLSIVKEYIDAHGGTIRLLPSLSGAHFQIELPNEI